jgi:Fe-S cluster biosynthesis and repair protein YggX
LSNFLTTAKTAWQRQEAAAKRTLFINKEKFNKYNEHKNQLITEKNKAFLTKFCFSA